MLKILYKKIWVPFMGRLLSKFIPLLEGKVPSVSPTYDIDGDKKKQINN
tara:strand:+ start:1603 stop:1749 length:147 start_codon:yes stop_codon:yes gene_type:complete